MTQRGYARQRHDRHPRDHGSSARTKTSGLRPLAEVDEFAKTAREKRLISMVRAFRQVGTPSFFPPGTAVEPLKIVRAKLTAKISATRNFTKNTRKWSAKNRRRYRRKKWKSSSKNCRATQKSSTYSKAQCRWPGAAALSAASNRVYKDLTYALGCVE